MDPFMVANAVILLARTKGETEGNLVALADIATHTTLTENPPPGLTTSTR